MKQSIRVVTLSLPRVVGSKPPWSFEGSTWTCEQTQVFESSCIKGLSKFFVGSAPLLQLALGEDSWTLLRDGQPWTSGSWSRKSLTKRSVMLALGADAISALELDCASAIGQEASVRGVDAPLVDARLGKSKLAFTLKVDRQAGTVSGVLRGRLRFTGTLNGTLNGQPFIRPWKTSIRLKARSDSVPTDTDRRSMTATGEPTTLVKLYPVTSGVSNLPGQLVEQPIDGGTVLLQRPISGGDDSASRVVFERPVGDMLGGHSTHYQIHLAAAATLGSGELDELQLEASVVLRRTGPVPDVVEILVEPAVYSVTIPPPVLGAPAPPNNINLVTFGPMIDASPDDILELHIKHVSEVASAPSDDDLLIVRLDSAYILVPLRPAGG